MRSLLVRGAYMMSIDKKSKSLYEVLQVSKIATAQQIKNSYYKLAKQYHPDAHQNKANVEQSFKQINEAYNVLKDSLKRKDYDQQNFTAEGQKKQYKFYNTQHNYGYNAKSYRKNPYQSTNPFQSSFNQSSYSAGTNPYNGDFSNFYTNKTNKQYSNANEAWEDYVKNQHRKNVAQNKKIGLDRLKKSNMIVYGIIGLISVYVIGQLTFKIYQFNSFYRIRTYPQKLDSRELMEYQMQSRNLPRRDYY